MYNFLLFFRNNFIRCLTYYFFNAFFLFTQVILQKDYIYIQSIIYVILKHFINKVYLFLNKNKQPSIYFSNLVEYLFSIF